MRNGKRMPAEAQPGPERGSLQDRGSLCEFAGWVCTRVRAHTHTHTLSAPQASWSSIPSHCPEPVQHNPGSQLTHRHAWACTQHAVSSAVDSVCPTRWAPGQVMGTCGPTTGPGHMLPNAICTHLELAPALWDFSPRSIPTRAVPSWQLALETCSHPSLGLAV